MSINVNKSPNSSYAFSVKVLKNPKEATAMTYVSYIDHMYNHGLIKYIFYEYDSQDIMHIHGVIILRKGFLKKKLCYPGFNTDLTEITDEEGWLKYCNKQSDHPLPNYKKINLFDSRYCV